jgi:excinuclease UvrABC ATPase subunit
MSSRDEHIRIRGARANNLREVDLDVPKRSLVVVTGVSGSGKSSLVFGTIAAEAQRQLNETFSAYVRQRMPHYGTPDVDRIDGLSAAVIVDQRRLGGSSRSTVGTATDIAPIVRLLFSRVGSPTVYPSNRLSFNDPEGMCPRCLGSGIVREADPDKLVDRSLSLDDGALQHPTMNVGTWPWRMYARAGFDNDVPVRSWSRSDWQTFLYADDGPDAFEGLVTRFRRIYLDRDPKEVSESYLRSFDRFSDLSICSECQGTRLNAAARACEVNGRSIVDWNALQLGELRRVVRAVREPEAATMVAEIDERLGQLEDIGLGYLTLERPTSSLSGGESQRIKVVRHLGSSLIDLMYVLDEPSVGLHPADIHQVTQLLRKLRDRGNTIIVVEHDRDIICAADHVIDVGPGPGSRGGEIVFEGSVRSLLRSATSTGKQLGRHLAPQLEPREPREWLAVRSVSGNNLDGIDVDVPLGVLVVVTGVAGAGKTSLLEHGVVPALEDVIVVDQSPVGTSVRSCPATYTGLMGPLRRAFAESSGLDQAQFSFNSAGACPTCDGRGMMETELSFMDPVIARCPDCDGTRYRPEVLEHELDGRSIADVLALTAEEAAEQMTIPAVAHRARTIVEVGLGYLTLGQPLSTLSGGEAQRIKLASHLAKRGSTFVLDEPTTGLHMADVQRLVQLFEGLVERGNTVIVAEHDLDVVARADWVIELGPGGGSLGGLVTFTGTVAELLDADTPTAIHLARTRMSVPREDATAARYAGTIRHR